MEEFQRKTVNKEKSQFTNIFHQGENIFWQY